MTIGELSRTTGVPPSKIRYYEKTGVLPPPKRTESGYRLYDPAAAARLQLLARGKLLGLTLAELADLVRAADKGCCGEVDPLVERLLREKLAHVEHQLVELEALRTTLVRALRRLTPEGAVSGTNQKVLACISDSCTPPTRKEVIWRG